MTTRSCPVCASKTSTRLDQRGGVPILMHSLFDSPEAARAAPRVAVDLQRCDSCGFAWNAAFDPSAIVYGPDYDNAQSHSAEFRAHLDARIDAIFARAPQNKPLTIVEVGCGQGDFLARLIERHPGRVANAIGFDPAWRGADGEGPRGARLYRRFFDATASVALADVVPDVVISRHTIEHIADPLAFLRAIRAGIGNREGVMLFLETPDIDWIIKKQAFEDVFYEHCSIFDPASMGFALRAAGFRDIETELCFGEQYLWTVARSGQAGGAASPMSTANRSAATGAINTAGLVAHWREWADSIAKAGGRAGIWGAGAKGMTFAQIIDPDGAIFRAIIDVNPGKQGRFIGVSGHPVVAPEGITILGLTDLVVMNPNYLDEIATILQRLGSTARLHPLHERQAP